MTECLACGELSRLLTLASMYSPYDPKFRRQVGICCNCGHIQQSPLISSEELQLVHERFFGQKYYQPGRDVLRSRKAGRVLSFLDEHIVPSADLLDVGAGEGWLLKLVRQRGASYYAIEGLQSLADDIRRDGGAVVGETIYDDGLSRYSQTFDVIVFRHVVEHLLRPREALHRIAGLLKPGGLLYMALPNSADVNSDKGLRTSFFRPVHVSYFTPQNAENICIRAGLTIKYREADREIRILARKPETPTETHLHASSFDAQYSRYRRLLRAARRRDLVRFPVLLAGWLKRRLATLR